MQKRFLYLDNITAILIIYVIFFFHLPGHTGVGDEPYFIYIRNIFDFFMAWFFFKGGMNFHHRPLSKELNSVYPRLLRPYIIINVICIILWIAANYRTIDVIDFFVLLKESIARECVSVCYPLWFLFSLAIVRLSYQFFTTFNYSKIIFALISLLLATFLGWLTYSSGYHYIPYWIGNIFLGIFFFILGDLMRNVQFNKLVLLISCLIYIIHLYSPHYLDFNNNRSDFYLLSVLYDIAGIVVINNLFKLFFNKRIPILTHIGRNSMVYYITHGTFFYVLFVAHNFVNTGWHLFVVSIIITICFLITMDYVFRIKTFRWMIGEY